MDLSFSFARMRAAAPQDAQALLAALGVMQAAAPTAALAARIAAAPLMPRDPCRALVAIFTDPVRLSAGVAALGGSFHPRVAAAAAGKAGSTLMKPGFTTAF